MKEKIIELTGGLEQVPIKERKNSLIHGDTGDNKFIRQENVGAIKHRNYLDYLELCYANHYSPVVRPDFIWYELLCELAIMVKDKPEDFREFFTTVPGKTELIVVSNSLDKLPLEKIMDMFKSLVPSGVENYIPVFSTSTPDSTEAFYASFADAVSPFYNYSMLMCGFPSIVVQGTVEDWTKLSDYWKNLIKIKVFSKCSKAIEEYASSVQTVLDSCRDTFITDASADTHWKGMFKVENCGSGHDRLTKGWITKLFRKQPTLAYSENFSSHVSKVNYTQLDTKMDYSAYYGLFSSDIDGTILRPKYGCIITEDMSSKPKSKKPADEMVRTIRSFDIESTPVEAKAKKLKAIWKVGDEILVAYKGSAEYETRAIEDLLIQVPFKGLWIEHKLYRKNKKRQPRKSNGCLISRRPGCHFWQASGRHQKGLYCRWLQSSRNQGISNQ